MFFRAGWFHRKNRGSILKILGRGEIMKHIKLSGIALTLLVSALMLYACGNSSNAPAGAAQSPAAKTAPSGKGTSAADRLIFQKWVEPREQAFSLYYPRGWQVSGGLYYVDPDKGGGPSNSFEPKCDVTIQADASGTVQMRFLPDYLYCDTRQMPVGQMGLFPIGSNYNGMPVLPVMTAKQFITDYAFRKVRPNATQVKVVEAKSVPELAAYYQRQSFIPGSKTEAALVTFQYQESGRAYREQIMGVTYTLGQLGAGLWGSKAVVAARAPLDAQKQYDRQFLFTYASVRINPQWLAKLMKAAAVRAGIAADVQRYAAQIDSEITANRQKTNADIQHENYLTITGQEEYINPYTNETERRPDGYKYHWQNASGEIIVTDNDDYSPNYDPDVKRTDFKRSAVRPR
jgi:hypothetical protein